jgi:hypothetical protein
MIKGKPPFPFETIALAVEFAPGLSFLVSETRRLSDVHGALAIFIHVGKKTSEKQRELSTLLNSFGFHDGNSRVYWEQGEIVNCILKICKHEVVDLLIAGASQNENFNLPPGVNAVGLAVKSKCSVLIYKNNRHFTLEKIIVNNTDHKKSGETFRTALYLAEKENISSLLVSGDGNETFDEFINDFYSQTCGTSVDSNPTINEKKVSINYFSLAKENCSTITEYAFKNNVDLIVTHSSDHHLLIFDRITVNDGIESMLKNLPCNLLIIHSRLPE